MRKRPDQITFFIDVDLGNGFFRKLSQESRWRTEFHDDHFPHGTDDSVWIPFIAHNGWIGVTHDKKMRAQHRPIIESAAARLIMVVGKHPLDKQASNFIVSFERIARFVRRHNAPYTAKLYQPPPSEAKKINPKGRIELWGEW